MTLLYLDFDGAFPARFMDRVTWCARVWRWSLVAVRIDKTRNGWHVVVGVAESVEPALVVAAQSILGSDYKREAFNLMRVQSLPHVSPFWRERWNVLYSHHAKPLQEKTNGTASR